jgi:hypothetical protein
VELLELLSDLCWTARKTDARAEMIAEAEAETDLHLAMDARDHGLNGHGRCPGQKKQSDFLGPRRQLMETEDTATALSTTMMAQPEAGEEIVARVSVNAEGQGLD